MEFEEPERRAAERREGHCEMHTQLSTQISRQGGMWTLLMFFIAAMLGFAGYVGKSAHNLDKSVETFTAVTIERMKMYDGTFLDVKSMVTLQGEMIRDIDGRVKHLEYRIDNRPPVSKFLPEGVE